ncbi:hypothetical protein BDW66DRAFT_138964 [Aspergillus desertorum]
MLLDCLIIGTRFLWSLTFASTILQPSADCPRQIPSVNWVDADNGIQSSVYNALSGFCTNIDNLILQPTIKK